MDCDTENGRGSKSCTHQEKGDQNLNLLNESACKKLALIYDQLMDIWHMHV